MKPVIYSEDKNEKSMAVVVRNLTKRFGPTIALNGVSFDLGKGSTLLIAGPNGSGKSTLLKIMCGIIKKPDDAQVLIFGLDPWKMRHVIFNTVSASFEDFGFNDFVSGLDYLRFVCALRRINKIPESIANGRLFRIASFWTKPIRSYSSGMRRKLAVVQALISSPELLILDEPMVALDKRSRDELIELLQQRRLDGKTTIISSHILTNLEELVTEMLVLVDGRVRAFIRAKDKQMDIESIYSHALNSA